MEPLLSNIPFASNSVQGSNLLALREELKFSEEEIEALRIELPNERDVTLRVGELLASYHPRQSFVAPQQLIEPVFRDRAQSEQQPVTLRKHR